MQALKSTPQVTRGMRARGSALSLLLGAAGSTRAEEQLAPGLEAARGFQIPAVTALSQPPGAEAFPWTSRALHPIPGRAGKAACPAELEFRNFPPCRASNTPDLGLCLLSPRPDEI